MATPRICSVEGCGKKHFGLGFCSMHYKRHQKHGDPEAGRTEAGKSLIWLSSQLTQTTDDCILWPFPSVSRGYGTVRHNGKQRPANRVMCELAHGAPLNEKFEAAHSCGNPLCVNPRHLRWATPTENQADKVGHGTHNIGSRNPRAKLDEATVAAIRARLGSTTQLALAAEFGVSASTISMIRHGQRWQK